MDKKNIEDVMALTPMQEGLLYHYLKEPENEYYFGQLTLVISGEIDLALFKQAWSVVVETNEMLRTQFRWKKTKEPVQVVLQHHTPQVDLVEYPTGKNAGDEEENRTRKEQWIEGIKQADRNKKFNLQQVPFRITLCKLETSGYVMILSNHHILLDGWSTGVILKEFFKVYNDLYRGEQFLETTGKTKFKEFVQWVQNQDVKKQEIYWRKYLRGFDTQTEISIKRRQKNVAVIGETGGTGNYVFCMDMDLQKRIETAVMTHKVSLAALFYAAWGVLLQKYNNSEDVIFGTTVSGRSAKLKGIEHMVGLFINTLPLRFNLPAYSAAREAMTKVDETLKEKESYESTPLVDIKNYSEIDTQEELFDSVVVMENYPLDTILMRQHENQNKNLFVHSYSMFERTNYDLTMVVSFPGDIKIDFIYHELSFDEEIILNMSRHFVKVIRHMIFNPGSKMMEIEVISEEEKRTILYDFNNKQFKYPPERTIHELFENQVERNPDHEALVGKEDGCMGARVEGEKEDASFGDIHISYRVLNDKSDRLAHCLSERGVQPGTIVGIMVGRSLEMVIGILGILKAGGAYLPIEPDFPPERIRYMLADSAAIILLTAPDYSNEIKFEKEIIYLSDAINRVPTTPQMHLSLLVNAPVTSSAYIIYTSGSTGKPKGVIINHQPAVNILEALQAEYPLKELDTYLLKTSYVFDVSIAELFGWFWDGGRLAILEKGGEKDPAAILNAIERGRITHINFVPSMFNVFLDELSFNNRNKLSSLKYIFLAGEVLLPGLVEKFRRLDTGIPLENIYGPTEGTVYSSKYSLSQWQSGSIPIGRPMLNVRLYIFDKDNHHQSIGVPGELCIAGIGLARGYLNQPELTAKKFCLRRPGGALFEKTAPPGPPRKNFLLLKGAGKKSQKFYMSHRSYMSYIYKTGDLARWLPDGNIDFLGRIDHQVKVRGFRIELEEIKNRLLSYDDIKDAVVIAGKDPAQETYLCAYVLLKEDAGEWASRLRTYLSGHLPGYMVPSYFVKLERMPLTPSGKVDLKALPEPQITPAVSYTPPRNARERALVNIWSEVLRVNSEKIGIDDGFFQLGGHSLKAMTLASHIHKKFGVTIPLGEIFKTSTIRGLTSCIRGREEGIYTSIEPLEEKEYYPLSSAQKRLFFLDKFEDSGTAYNMSAVFRIEGKTDKARFESTFNALIAWHEPLRTSFHLLDDKAVQRIHDEIVIGHWSLVIGEADRKEIDRLIKDFVKPFDLSQAPLLRAGLWKLAEQEHLFLFDIHHIVSDGMSIEILFDDFIRLYEGKKPPQQRIQYKDFILWQHQLLETDQIKEQENYWLEIYPDWAEIPLLNLPTDFPRPAVFCFEGGSYEFKVEPGTGSRVKDFYSSIGATLYMTLMACLNILLHKYTGQEDIVVGSGIMGRRHGDLHHIIGMFVNSLAVRNYPHHSKTCLEFLKEVKETSIQAFENQDVQFEYLVDQLNPPRNPARNPIFDVLLVVQNFEPFKREIKTPRFIPYPLENKTSKLDFTLFVDEIENEIFFNIEYCTALFKKATIQQMADHFLNVLRQVISEPGIKIGDLDILSPGEKQQLLIDFNETAADYPGDKTIHQLFEEQVEKTPEHIALVGKEEGGKGRRVEGKQKNVSLAYNELNEQSNQLAHFLKEKGIQPDTIVGIMIERSVEMIIGILGILKAGGAYLPIDPEYPEERIRYMLADSGAKILLTMQEFSDTSFQHSSLPSFHLHLSPAPATCLAYIIYTSGSTGKPKGVLVQHHSVVNILTALQIEYPLGEKDTYLFKTSYLFDVSVIELFDWFLGGGRLAILETGGEKDPTRILHAIETQGITHINFVPSVFNAFIEVLNEKNIGKLFSLKYIFLAGEALLPGLVDKFRRLDTNAALENIYGPTEGTVYSSRYSLYEWEGSGNISIGKPLPNVRLYILDKNDHLLRVGVPGELFISGAGVARGYLNNPELTAEKFIDKALSSLLLALRRTEKAKNTLRGRNLSGGFQKIPETMTQELRPNPFTLRAKSQEPRAKLYKTGDLARWLVDGNIEFLGRIDYQIKIRGFRIEPGEIENQILNHSDVKEAVVVSREDEKRDKYLCAYIVPTSSAAFEKTSAITELKRYLSGKLPGYMVPSYFVQLEKIPLTGSGKVDRKALPEPEVKTGDNYAAPRDTIEKKLAKIWSEVLQVAHLMIGIDDNFFALGGHSLKAIILAAKIHKTFNINLKLIEIFKTATIKELARMIETETKEEFTPIKIAEKKKYYKLSSAQKRMYILQQIDEISTVYNMSALFELEGELDKEKLEKVFQQLIQRHESLRTSFQLVGAESMQRIHDRVEFEIEYDRSLVNGHQSLVNCQGRGEVPSPINLDKIIQDFIRPFDLSQAPLLRVGIVEIREHQHILMVDMHHIIGDGTSTRILIEEFESLYAGKELPALAFQYKDYSEWQNGEKAKGALGKQEAYWLSQFTAEIPVPNLPTDYPRPIVQQFDGNTLGFGLGPEETQALRTCALKHGTTLYILLLTIYTIFLSKLSGQEHMIVGAPVASRRHANLHQIIGMFVNTLPLTYYPVPAKTFQAFLKEVTDKTLEAFENQDYPYEELIDRLAGNITRDASRNPLFDVTFLLQNVGGNIDKAQIPGLVITPIKYPTNTSKFDLALQAIETGETLSFTFEYSTCLFKAETLQRFSDYFKRLLIEVPRNVSLKLSDMEIISGRERHRLLYEFNDTKADYPRDEVLHQLFEGQVERSPDRIALVGKEEGWKCRRVEGWTDAPSGQILNAFGQDSIRAKSQELRAVTYKELNEKSNQLTHFLGSKGVQAGSIVGIIAEPSREVVIGLLGILKTGAAYLPIDPRYPEERIRYMLTDSASKILFSTQDLSKEIQFEKEIIYLSDTMNCVPAPQHLSFHPSTIPSLSTLTLTSTCQVSSAKLAYIIYTSGSTGVPKGVMVEHRGLVNYLHWAEKMYIDPDGARCDFPFYSSLAFDLTVTSIYLPLISGNTLYVYEENENEFILSKILRDNKVRVVKLTPTHLRLLVDMDICDSSVKRFIVGGEALTEALAHRVYRKFSGKIAIYNEYGPTETVVGCMIYKFNPGESRSKSVPIGTPADNVQIYLLDRGLQPVPEGVTGEIYISGDGVARGYLNNPELTSERFINYKLQNTNYNVQNYKTNGIHAIMQSCNHASRQYHSPSPQYPITPLPQSPIYRTGDLARWLVDGNIEFLGRIDYQIKIRGFRIEPGEIENQILNHSDVKEAVVVSREDEKRDKYLCAYIVLTSSAAFEKTSGITELKRYLSGKLPGYMVPSYFVQLEKIPLTGSGKVDRKALPVPEVKTGDNYAAPRDAIEEKLLEIWTGVLETHAPPGIDDNFFDLGGHSLKAMVMISRIHQDFNVNLVLGEIFKSPTIRGLARSIKYAVKDRFISIEPVEKKEYYLLSSAQKRIYVVHQLEPQGIGYNMPFMLKLEREPDVEGLEQAFKKLVKRHESFRTSFGMIDDQPMQRVHDTVEFEIEYHIAERTAQSIKQNKERRAPGAVRCASIIRPFDLSKAPLLRFALIKTGIGDKPTLMIDMHHIISDGLSMEIFRQELNQLYASSLELSPLPIQYKDYSEWQNSEKAAVVMKGQEDFWLKAFAGELPLLNLPIDFPRPSIQSFRGSSIRFTLDLRETGGLKEIAAAWDLTPFMLLLSITNILLAKISNQEDIIVGVPLAGRRHADLGHMIGMFINTLALRNFPIGARKVSDFSREVGDNTLGAFENQEFPFEELVEKLPLERDTSRNPLYDVVFSWLNRETRWEDLLGMKVKPLPYEGNTAKFDLILVVLEPGPGQPFTFTFYFSIALFKKETIERFINYFKRVVGAVLENPDQTVAEVEILSGEERKQLLVNFNHTGGPYPEDQTLVELFENQVDRIPDHAALIGQIPGKEESQQEIPNTKESFGRISAFGEMNLSYRELNEQANQLAHLLRSKSIKSGAIVAIMVGRSIDMIIGILGILKTGAAYLPLNPRNPAERVRYLLADSGAKILLCGVSKKSEVSVIIDVIDINSLFVRDRHTGPAAHLHLSPAPINSLAYIIYTSGSTGKPKGVPITHANLSPLLHWGYCQLGLGTGDRTLQNLSYFFDWSVWEIFITLTSGARLYMVSEEILLDPEACIAFMNEHKITVLHVTPSQYQYLVHVPHKLEALKYLFIGAEKLTHELVRRSFASVISQCRVFNMYGPTEATIISAVLEIDRSCFDVFKGLSSVPIGGPVGNMELFVLNKYLKLCPVNTAGELYIGGDGVARGYLNNPELTAEKFGRAVISHSSLVIGSPSKLSTNDQCPMTNDRFYRTGDLARWLVDGAVEFLGRIDHQVKIRGYRIELGEIENQLLKHPGVKETIVVVKEDERREKYLCAYLIKSIDRVTAGQLKEYLTGLLPVYMAPAYFVFIEEIPLTPNGKVDWKALPGPETIGEGREYIAPMDEVEERLASLWSGVLGIGKNRISREDNFFELGGHSLKATRLLSGIHKAFNVKLSLIRVFEVPQLKSMADSIKDAASEQYIPIPLVEKREYYELSFNQERLWFIHQQEPASPAYNMPGSFKMNHAVDEHALRKALNKIAVRHESFRTGFKMVNDEPVQFILAEVKIPVQFIDISSTAVDHDALPWLETNENKQTFLQGVQVSAVRKVQIFLEMSGKIFNLTTPPLLRVVLVRTGPACYELMYNMHHIISDGWSLEMFKKEFFYFYEQYRGGSAVDPELLGPQYKDFALWYKHRVESGGQNHPSHRYWREKLEKGVPVLQLPRNTSGDKADVKGAEYRSLIDRDVKEKLKKLAATHNTTLFMVMFVLYILVLRRYSNQQEIVTSIISAGRNHGTLSDMIGFFVNSLLFTTHVEDDEPFEDFLQRVHTNVLECFKHQDYPLDLVVREMNIRYPEIPVSFNMINLQEGAAEEEINVFKPFHIPNAHDVKFDIEPYIMEYKNGIGTWWSYKKSIFSPITIEYFVRDYIRLMEFFTTHPHQSYNNFRETVKSKKKKRKIRRGISQDL